MTLTQQQYTQASADLTDLATIPPVAALPEYAMLTGAIGALRPKVPDPHVIPFDLGRVMTCLWTYNGRDRYTRDQWSLIVTTDTLDVPLFWTDLNHGGIILLPAHPVYRLSIAPFVGDDTFGSSIEIGRYVTTGTERLNAVAHCAIPAALADGDYMLEFVACDANGAAVAPLDSMLPLLFQLNRHNTPQTHLLFQSTSYEWAQVMNANPPGSNPAPSLFHWARIPIALNKPRARPLKPRVAVPFSRLTDPHEMFLRYLVPLRPGANYRPVRDKNGRWSTANHQGYYPAELRSPWPTVPQVDGPPGVCTGNMATTYSIGHNGGIYTTEGAGNCFAHYQPDGTRQTLIGWVDDVPPYLPGELTAQAKPRGPGERRMVGDWSLVDPTYRYLLNCWGWCWDGRTTVRGKDTNTQINGEPVHDGPVVWYGFDRAKGGRMLSATWDGADPNRGTPQQKPAVMRELLTGLGDPWGAAWNDADGLVYVCLRAKHQIVRIRATNLAANIDSVFVQGAKLGTFADDGLIAANWAAPFYRFFIPNAGVTLAQVQAQPCQGPECIRIMDGYVAWSSGAQRDVRRSKDGVTIERLCEHPMTNKSHFLIFDLSDGTFGPRWTVFTSSYDEQRYGRPRAWSPSPNGVLLNSKEWVYQGFVSKYVHSGAGGQWSSMAYTMACTVRFGRLVCGSSEEGMAEITLALPGEIAPNLAQMISGGDAYLKSGQRMLYGHQGASMIDASVTSYYLDQSA